MMQNPFSLSFGKESVSYIRHAFWDKTCVHDFTEEMTDDSMDYHRFLENQREGCHDDYWIYRYDEEQAIEWECLESAFSHGTAMDKLEYLVELNRNKVKNRFVHRMQ